MRILILGENYSSKYDERIEASVRCVATFGDGFREQKAMRTVAKSWLGPTLVSQLWLVFHGQGG